MEWILAFAGILFGGGMIGNLIIFFIKRHDDNKSKQKDIYKKVYEKLCSYKTLLEKLMLDYYKYCNILSKGVEHKANNIYNNIEQIERLRKQIKKQEKKCKKEGVDENNCIVCEKMRANLLQLYNDVSLNYSISNELIDECKNYWTNHDEDITSITNNNMNIHNYLLVCKDKNINNSLYNIDINTIKIHGCLYAKKDNEKIIIDLILKQMELIEYSLVLLSKRL